MHTDTLQDIHRQAASLAQLLTFGEVCSLLRKSRSGLYKLMASDPNFPKPVKDGWVWGPPAARCGFVSLL